MIAATKFRGRADRDHTSFGRLYAGRLQNTLLLEGDGLMPGFPRSR